MFEANERSAEVTIANRGDEIGTFEIGWTDMSMTPEGGLRRLEEQPAWSVQPYVRFSPRRVTLAPSESQVIKIAVRRDDTLSEGEYFSHLRVVTINSEDPEAGDAPQSAPGVAVSARTAIAIPVIWRNSREASMATIDRITPEPQANLLRVDVRRLGLLSVRGFLHLLDGDNAVSAKPLAEPVPLVIYPNVDQRSVTISLDEGITSSDLPADATVLFTAEDDLDRSSTVFASKLLFPDE